MMWALMATVLIGLVGVTVDFTRAQMLRTQMQAMARRAAKFMETYDVWVAPTLAQPPVKNGVIDINERDPMKGFLPLADYVPFTPIQNLTGQPAMSLPLHWSADGLPIGMMLAGRFGDESTLFRLAAQLEEARPWKDKHPKVWN